MSSSDPAAAVVRSAGAPGGEPGLSPPAHEHPHGVHSGRHLGWRAQLAEFIRFGMVGGVAFVVDVGLFNLLRFGPGELLEAKPVTAKIISAGVATLVAWLGNRHFAFARHRTDNPGRELVGFILVNIGGALIAGACLAVSHYALGLTSPLADNISANVVGLGLGTAFRYFAYKWLIFTGQPEPHPEAPADAEGTTHGSGRA